MKEQAAVPLQCPQPVTRSAERGQCCCTAAASCGETALLCPERDGKSQGLRHV